LEYLTPNSDQFNAVQDWVSDGLKALRHEHPVYKGVSTLELTAIWARLNNMMAACQAGRAEERDARTDAHGNGQTSESRRDMASTPRSGEKRKADELEGEKIQCEARI
jgi:hypothetical protein